MIHDQQGGHLSINPMGGMSSECNYSISRGELNQFLRRECEARGIPLHFEHELKLGWTIPGQKAIFTNGKAL